MQVQARGGVKDVRAPALPGHEVADGEHAAVGPLVQEPGDVVQAPAGLRAKFRGLGIEQRQRHDVLGGFGQDGVNLGAGHKRRGLGVRVEQAFHPPPVDAATRGVHGDDLAVGQGLGRLADAKQGRHAELPRQRGHVAGDAAVVGHDGRRPLHGHHEARRAVGGHQHGSVREVVQVLVTPHQPHRPAGRADAGRLAAGKRHLVTRNRRLGLGPGLGEGGQLPRLQHAKRPVLGQRPLHVLGQAEMALQGHAPAGQGLGLLRGQTGQAAQFLGHGHVGQPPGRRGHQHPGLVGHLGGRRLQAVAVQTVGVGGDDPVHGVGAKAPDGVYQQFVAARGLGQPGVEHAGGLGGDKGQAGGGHGHVVVGDALEQPVGHGPGGEKAGQDKFIGGGQAIPGDV